jgi:hypothetical protein
MIEQRNWSKYQKLSPFEFADRRIFIQFFDTWKCPAFGYEPRLTGQMPYNLPDIVRFRLYAQAMGSRNNLKR